VVLVYPTVIGTVGHSRDSWQLREATSRYSISYCNIRTGEHGPPPCSLRPCQRDGTRSTSSSESMLAIPVGGSKSPRPPRLRVGLCCLAMGLGRAGKVRWSDAAESMLTRLDRPVKGVPQTACRPDRRCSQHIARHSSMATVAGPISLLTPMIGTADSHSHPLAQRPPTGVSQSV
jgi:hypothetical protein